MGKSQLGWLAGLFLLSLGSACGNSDSGSDAGTGQGGDASTAGESASAGADSGSNESAGAGASESAGASSGGSSHGAGAGPGGQPSATAGQGPGSEAGAPSGGQGGASGGGVLGTPVTVTMASDGTANHLGASICQLTLLSVVPDYQLLPESPSGDCPNGQLAYIRFYLNTSTNGYSALAGDWVTPSDGSLGGAVTFTSTTDGSIDNYQERNRARPLTAGMPITIVTNTGTVTFELDGNDVTVTDFELN